MGDYIKREDAIKEANTWSMFGKDNLESRLKRLPRTDVVYALLDAYVLYHAEVVMEDDIMKIKWRHGDKHYIVPFGGLLELWEKYEEHKHESSKVISERKE